MPCPNAPRQNLSNSCAASPAAPAFLSLGPSKPVISSGAPRAFRVPSRSEGAGCSRGISLQLQLQRSPDPSVSCSLRMTMLIASSRKLPQKPHIILEKQRQFAHPVLHHRKPIHAHSECKTRKPLGIVVHESVTPGVHHPGAKKLNPPGVLADPAAAPAAYMAARVHFRRRFCERE